MYMYMYMYKSRNRSQDAASPSLYNGYHTLYVG